MSAPGTGDPASCSSLGGALRTTAARLLDAAVQLDPTSEQRHLLDRLVPALDEAGSRLQVHAQELVEVAVSIGQLAERVAQAGLQLDRLRVLEPLGIVDVYDAQRRILARPSLQAQADRIAARLGRSRAQLSRQLGSWGTELDRLTPTSEPTVDPPPPRVD